MSAKPCRVLIVDDSTIFRSQIRAALEGVPGVEVVGFAPNGRLALEQMKVREVDVVTLDLEMPELNGVETLKQMKVLDLKARVIVFSGQTKSGAESTMTALNLGAFDFVTKPIAKPGENPAELIRSHLLPKILQFVDVSPSASAPSPVVPKPTRYPTLGPWDFWKPKLLVIASSTGGPNALDQIFSQLRPPLNIPILIAQHMPPLFTASLAERLSMASGLPVKEAQHNQVLTPGTVAIAPGDFHLRIKRSEAGHVVLLLDQGPQRNSVRPAADYLFESAAEVFGPACFGLVLTGMGADGCDGAQAIKQNGGRVMIQNRESCVVFGMPGAVFDAQAYDRIGTLPEIASTIGDLGICQNDSLQKVMTR